MKRPFKPEWGRRYIDRLRSRLVADFGGACNWCQSDQELEFAHLRETGLRGMGRGSKHRLLDVQRNRDAYTLLCRACHAIFDGRTYRRAEPEAEEILEASRDAWALGGGEL